MVLCKKCSRYKNFNCRANLVTVISCKHYYYLMDTHSYSVEGFLIRVWVGDMIPSQVYKGNMRWWLTGSYDFFQDALIKEEVVSSGRSKHTHTRCSHNIVIICNAVLCFESSILYRDGRFLWSSILTAQ